MTRNIILPFLFCLTLTSCGQSKNPSDIKGLTIDPSIKTEVEKHTTNSKELDVLKDKMLVYINSGTIETYQNDSLILTSKNQEINAPFKSFYFWSGDTLKIDGAFGLLEVLALVLTFPLPQLVTP